MHMSEHLSALSELNSSHYHASMILHNAAENINWKRPPRFFAVVLLGPSPPLCYSSYLLSLFVFYLSVQEV
jgi:hypothetical protein